jgi:hypothetical protein
MSPTINSNMNSTLNSSMNSNFNPNMTENHSNFQIHSQNQNQTEKERDHDDMANSIESDDMASSSPSYSNSQSNSNSSSNSNSNSVSSSYSNTSSSENHYDTYQDWSQIKLQINNNEPLLPLCLSSPNNSHIQSKIQSKIQTKLPDTNNQTYSKVLTPTSNKRKNHNPLSRFDLSSPGTITALQLESPLSGFEAKSSRLSDSLAVSPLISIPESIPSSFPSLSSMPSLPPPLSSPSSLSSSSLSSSSIPLFKLDCGSSTTKLEYMGLPIVWRKASHTDGRAVVPTYIYIFPRVESISHIRVHVDNYSLVVPKSHELNPKNSHMCNFALGRREQSALFRLIQGDSRPQSLLHRKGTLDRGLLSSSLQTLNIEPCPLGLSDSASLPLGHFHRRKPEADVNGIKLHRCWLTIGQQRIDFWYCNQKRIIIEKAFANTISTNNHGHSGPCVDPIACVRSSINSLEYSIDSLSNYANDMDPSAVSILLQQFEQSVRICDEIKRVLTSNRKKLTCPHVD